MKRWPHVRDRVPHDPGVEVIACRACGGSGCNRYKPNMTAGMREACPACDGAGYDERKKAVAGNPPVAPPSPAG